MRAIRTFEMSHVVMVGFQDFGGIESRITAFGTGESDHRRGVQEVFDKGVEGLENEQQDLVDADTAQPN